jgi:hypothetical protein
MGCGPTQKEEDVTSNRSSDDCSPSIGSPVHTCISVLESMAIRNHKCSTLSIPQLAVDAASLGIAPWPALDNAVKTCADAVVGAVVDALGAGVIAISRGLLASDSTCLSSRGHGRKP